MVSALQRRQARPWIVKLTVYAYDVAAAFLAMYFSVRIRYAMSEGEETSIAIPWIAATLFAGVCAVLFPIQGLHRPVWRFTSLNDVIRVLYAVTLATLVFLFWAFTVNRLQGLPRSSVVIAAPLLAVLLIGARYLRQVFASGDWRSLIRLEDPTTPAAILAGGHGALDGALRELGRRRGGGAFRIRGLVEPGGSERGRSIRGVPVLGGPEEAKSALISLSSQDGPAPQLVIVDPRLTRQEMQAFVEAVGEAGAQLVRTRADGELSPLDAADLLGRTPRYLDHARTRGFLEGKRVLVTGAGGTIGSELTRQVAEAGPERLALLDASEHNLYRIELDMREAGFSHNVDAYLGDVRDAPRVTQVIREAQPHVILHAAALKHVPLMEANPTEAVLTNLAGTMVVADAAADEGGVETFVLISTDKAVMPSNVMGASKRAAEMVVQAVNADPNSQMRAVAVRFGNVLGSTGSVVPLFERQIARGGPITVTHRDMTRYFMTTNEAAALVLQAGALASDDEVEGVYVLDMGEPVKIEDLARQLCRLRGREPGRDVEIVYTGLRPGEKVHEDLFYEAEEVSPTQVDGVMAARAPLTPLPILRERLQPILDAAMARDRAAMFDALHALLPEFSAAGRKGARPQAVKAQAAAD